LAAREPSACATGDQDREVVVVVLVAVADAAAVEHHRALEQVRVAFLRLEELLQQVRELLDVEAVDELDLPLLLGIAAVVARLVVAFGNAEERVAAIAALVRE